MGLALLLEVGNLASLYFSEILLQIFCKMASSFQLNIVRLLAS